MMRRDVLLTDWMVRRGCSADRLDDAQGCSFDRLDQVRNRQIFMDEAADEYHCCNHNIQCNCTVS